MNEDRIVDILFIGAIIIVIVLKITNVIIIPWLWLTSIIWIPFGFECIAAIVITIVLLLKNYVQKK